MNTDAEANKMIGSFYIIIIGVSPACHWVRFWLNAGWISHQIRAIFMDECWGWTEEPEDTSSSAVWLVILQVLISHLYINSLPGILQTAAFKK